MLAAVHYIAVFEQLVEIGAQRLDRRFQMLQFLRHIVGDVVGDDDAGFVQHDMPKCDAFG